MTEVKAEEHLVGHYTSLGDLKLDFRNNNLFNLLSSFVKGQSVVDIGCGAGFLLGKLKTAGKNVIGIEPSDGMRTLANKINPDIAILPTLTNQKEIDAVLMIDVLEHIEDDDKQVQEVRSILKKGGEFIFVVPAHTFLYGKRDKLMGHYRRYSLDTARDLLTRNGFHIESMRHWNALGVLPYLVSEKILGRELNSKSRHKAGILQKMLNLWFRFIENNFNFAFGLSIIGIATKDK